MPSHIHLIGGGPGTFAAFRKHIAAALPASTSSRGPLVAYVGAASGDDAGFEKMIGQEIVRAAKGRARVKGVKLASSRAKASTARALLEECDLVFVSGGDVEAGMNVVRDRDVLPVFKALAKEGRPIVGLSAGSIMLGRAWVRFPEGGEEGEGDLSTPQGRKKAAEEATLFPCMGLAPVYVDAHAEEDDWGELRVLLHLVAAKKASEPAPVGYGLTKKGGIRLDRAGRRVDLVPFGTSAPTFVVRKRKVVEARPLPLGEVTPLG